MKEIKAFYNKIRSITGDISRHHVGAYAAQSAYFFMLCFIPVILLLLTLVRFTPVTKADVMTAVIQVFPKSVDSLVTSIVNQVYNQSMGIIPITVIVALWSAGKGVLAVTTGLNTIYGCHETRNYVILRIRATLYTLMFLVVIMVLLVFSVFGNSLALLLERHLPFMKRVIEGLLLARTYVAPAVLVIFLLLIYKFLPNRKGKLMKQIPGSLFATIGWMIVSWIFSVYLDIFRGFSSMYGSLTTIVLIMLWLYFCMYSILLGGELNMLLADKIYVEDRKKKKKEDKQGADSQITS